MDLETVLKQRNALLKQGKGRLNKEEEKTLDVWSEKFNDLSHEWGTKRKNTLIQITQSAKKSYLELAGNKKEIELIYKPEWMEKGLQNTLLTIRNDEIRRGTTLIGPHRDEIHIELANMPARTHASQGEQRTISLALRVAGHHLLNDVHKTKPILLLDDVFSELDTTRRDHILAKTDQSEQCFITTTNTESINKEFLSKMRKFTIYTGTLSE